MYTPFLHTRGATARVEKIGNLFKLIFMQILAKLTNISENKKFAHHAHTIGCVFQIFAFLLFFVFKLACGEEFDLLWRFLANFATIKKLSKNIKVLIIRVLDATFVPNLTFLGLLSPEISFLE